jgi:hypothetical protein
MSRAKQQERVLNALKDSRGVSTWYAAIELGNLRLAATINQLRKQLKKEGDEFEINAVKEKGHNKFGEKISYSRYFLVKK